MSRKQKTLSTIDSCEVECLPYLASTIASKYMYIDDLLQISRLWLTRTTTRVAPYTIDNGSCYRTSRVENMLLHFQTCKYDPDLTLQLTICRIMNEIYMRFVSQTNPGTSKTEQVSDCSQKVRLQSIFQESLTGNKPDNLTTSMGKGLVRTEQSIIVNDDEDRNFGPLDKYCPR